MSGLSSFLAGGLFGVGLIVSGMTRPEKIVGFLDVFGAWDPTLAFVMAGAVLAHMTTAPLASRRPAPVYAAAFERPHTGAPDRALVGGSAMFGVGWGISGLCPGPAFVALASFELRPIVFAAAMLAGMGIYRITRRDDTGIAADDTCG